MKAYMIRHADPKKSHFTGPTSGAIDLFAEFFRSREKGSACIVASPEKNAFCLSREIEKRLLGHEIPLHLPENTFTEEPYTNHSSWESPFPHYGLCEHAGHKPNDFKVSARELLKIPHFKSFIDQMHTAHQGEITEQDRERASITLMEEQNRFINLEARAEPVVKALEDLQKSGVDSAVLVTHSGVIGSTVKHMAESFGLRGNYLGEISYLEGAIIDYDLRAIQKMGTIVSYGPQHCL